MLRQERSTCSGQRHDARSPYSRRRTRGSDINAIVPLQRSDAIYKRIEFPTKDRAISTLKNKASRLFYTDVLHEICTIFAWIYLTQAEYKSTKVFPKLRPSGRWIESRALSCLCFREKICKLLSGRTERQSGVNKLYVKLRHVLTVSFCKEKRSREACLWCHLRISPTLDYLTGTSCQQTPIPFSVNSHWSLKVVWMLRILGIIRIIRSR